MLAGQEITFLNSIVIGLTGVFIVMIELGLLALLVISLSKIIIKFNLIFETYELGKKKLNQNQYNSNLNSKENKENDKNEILEEEIAVIAASICEESGLKPEEFVITSIIKK